MKNKRILAIVFNNMEDIEFTTPYDIWQRNEIQVDFASINDEEFIKTKYNLKISTPLKLSDVNLENYDAIFLPGGSGVDNELNNKKLDSVLKHFSDANKYMIAICGAPQFLAVRGYLKGKKAIAFADKNIHSLLEVNGAIINKNCQNNQDCEVVVDKNIVTAMNYLSAPKLALQVVELLKEN